jgi:GNAT superfamily N-acetyltransferase
MVEPSPVARFFAAADALLERVDPAWWGTVVTDSRFPDVYDLNYARVDTAQPDLTLAEVEAALLPAVRAAEARHFHVVVFEPEGTGKLVQELGAGGHEISWDSAMEFAGPTPREPQDHVVEPVRDLDAEFWRAQEQVYREFDVHDRAALDQLIRWARETLAPAGRRWFTVREDGRLAGIGSLQAREGVAYVDDVMTFPEFRRRGIAGSIVTRIVREARELGAEHVMLLSDSPGAVRLYERLGFHQTGRVASAFSKLDADQPKGRSGSMRTSGSAAPPRDPDSTDSGPG